MIAIRLDGNIDGLAPLLSQLYQSPDISGVHLLEQAAKASGNTAESSMRSKPDDVSDAIIMVEGVSPKLLSDAVTESLSDAAIQAACGAHVTARGLYQLDFCMSSTS